MYTNIAALIPAGIDPHKALETMAQHCRKCGHAGGLRIEADGSANCTDCGGHRANAKIAKPKRRLRPTARPIVLPPRLRARAPRRRRTAGTRPSASRDGPSSEGGPDPELARCSICGLTRCQTPIFCSFSRALDDLRAAQCWGSA